MFIVVSGGDVFDELTIFVVPDGRKI